MSQSSGRDSADGTADVFTRRTITHRTVSRAQRPRKSVRGVGSSRASDMVSLPQSEACTVQALMDLALPRFVGLGDGPRKVHRYRLLHQRRQLQVVWIQVVKRTERGYRRHVLTWMDCHHRTMTQAQ